MGETEKPFACDFKGCGMSFPNEDHLQCHKKRHKMNLNIKFTGQNITKDKIPDQTPTPTRFVTCLETSLFQDFANPFEAEFRKGVQAVKSGAVLLCEEPANESETDSLNTPSIPPITADLAKEFSNIEEEENKIASPSSPPVAPLVINHEETTQFILPDKGNPTEPVVSISDESSQETILPQTLQKSSSVAATSAENVQHTPVITKVFTQSIISSSTATAAISASSFAVMGQNSTPESRLFSTQESNVSAAANSVKILTHLPSAVVTSTVLNATAVQSPPVIVTASSPQILKVAPAKIMPSVVQNVTVPTITSSAVPAAIMVVKVPIITSVPSSDPSLASVNPNPTLTAKQKLRETLIQPRKNSVPCISSVQVPIVQNITTASLSSTFPKPAAPNNSPSAKKRNTDVEDDDDRKRKYRENNKVAAQRFREKKKRQCDRLHSERDIFKSKYEELSKKNEELKKEISQLRSENYNYQVLISKQKEELSLHSKCPVTLEAKKQQNEGAQESESVIKVICTSSQNIETVSRLIFLNNNIQETNVQRENTSSSEECLQWIDEEAVAS